MAVCLVVACGSTSGAPPGTSTRAAGTIPPPGTTTAAAASGSTTGPLETTSSLSTSPPPVTQPDLVVGGDRPVTVRVPDDDDASRPAPFVLLLHGYQADGDSMDRYLRLGERAVAAGMLFAAPNGSVDRQGDRFWNATDACCDVFGSGVDDEAYLLRVVAEVQARWSVDPRRIFVIGHSNGGFMAYRLACHQAATFAAVVSFAGADAVDPATCRPSEPVTVLQVHGTGDTVVHYDGGTLIAAPYPGARTSAQQWAVHDGCDAAPVRRSDASHRVVPGRAPAIVDAWTGCRPGGHVELWTVDGASHVPDIADTFPADLVTFLLAHPKP